MGNLRGIGLSNESIFTYWLYFTNSTIQTFKSTKWLKSKDLVALFVSELGAWYFIPHKLYTKFYFEFNISATKYKHAATQKLNNERYIWTLWNMKRGTYSRVWNDRVNSEGGYYLFV